MHTDCVSPSTQLPHTAAPFSGTRAALIKEKHMSTYLQRRTTGRGRVFQALACALLMATLPTYAADDAAPSPAPSAVHTKQDFAQKLAAYEQRAIKGDIGAARLAGDMLLHAERLSAGTVQRDLPRAVAWLARAANKGDRAAASTLEQIAPVETPLDPVYEPELSGC
jgi:hypothetical protein